MNSRNGLPVLTMLFATLAAAGCSSGQAGGAPSSPPAPEVTSAKVLFNEVRDWADFTGRLEPVEHVDVRPRVGGYVESVGFVEGAAVKKGDLLFQIDPRPFQAAVDRLRADRERAIAELALARSYAGRAQRLLDQRAISQEEAEQRIEEADANAAAIKAFVVNRVGDLGFMLGIFGTFLVFGTVSIPEILAAAPGMAGSTIGFLGYRVDTMTVLCLLLFVGAMGKSAQLGLHTWLPDAMEGPTPVSALIHAATMVTAGVFMVCRLSPMFETSADRAARRDLRSAPRPACSPRRSAWCRPTSSASSPIRPARSSATCSSPRASARMARRCSTCSRTPSSRRCCSSARAR